MVILMVLGVWFSLSVPAAVVVGWMIRSGAVTESLELVGMDGPFAVFEDGRGGQVRVSLLERATS
jgi:hypothetical protein